MVLFGSLVLHHHHHEETFWELFYDLIIVVVFISVERQELFLSESRLEFTENRSCRSG